MSQEHQHIENEETRLRREHAAMYDALKSLQPYTKVIQNALSQYQTLSVPIDAPIAYIAKAANTVNAVDNGDYAITATPASTEAATGYYVERVQGKNVWKVMSPNGGEYERHDNSYTAESHTARLNALPQAGNAAANGGEAGSGEAS